MKISVHLTRAALAFRIHFIWIQMCKCSFAQKYFFYKKRRSSPLIERSLPGGWVPGSWCGRPHTRPARRKERKELRSEIQREAPELWNSCWAVNFPSVDLTYVLLVIKVTEVMDLRELFKYCVIWGGTNLLTKFVCHAGKFWMGVRVLPVGMPIDQCLQMG